jgi:hypothetical protein
MPAKGNMAECASVPPTTNDVLYIAGGVKDEFTMRRAKSLFRAVVTAQDLPSTVRFMHVSARHTHGELNVFAAAIDFNVGVLSDTIVGCDCSTFSSEVVLLRFMGKGSHNSSWTWSGPAYPEGRALKAFHCDPFGARKLFNYDVWRKDNAMVFTQQTPRRKKPLVIVDIDPYCTSFTGGPEAPLQLVSCLRSLQQRALSTSLALVVSPVLPIMLFSLLVLACGCRRKRARKSGKCTHVKSRFRFRRGR